MTTTHERHRAAARAFAATHGWTTTATRFGLGELAARRRLKVRPPHAVLADRRRFRTAAAVWFTADRRPAALLWLPYVASGAAGAVLTCRLAVAFAIHDVPLAVEFLPGISWRDPGKTVAILLRSTLARPLSDAPPAVIERLAVATNHAFAEADPWPRSREPVP